MLIEITGSAGRSAFITRYTVTDAVLREVLRDKWAGESLVAAVARRVGNGTAQHCLSPVAAVEMSVARPDGAHVEEYVETITPPPSSGRLCGCGVRLDGKRRYCRTCAADRHRESKRFWWSEKGTFARQESDRVQNDAPARPCGCGAASDAAPRTLEAIPG